MKKLNKNILFGLGAISAVVAPVATLVACGNSNSTDTNKNGKQTNGLNSNKPVALTVRPIADILSAAFEKSSNTIDLAKVNNQFELSTLLAEVSGFNKMSGISSGFEKAGIEKDRPALKQLWTNAKAKVDALLAAHPTDENINIKMGNKTFVMNFNATALFKSMSSGADQPEATQTASELGGYMGAAHIPDENGAGASILYDKGTQQFVAALLQVNETFAMGNLVKMTHLPAQSFNSFKELVQHMETAFVGLTTSDAFLTWVQDNKVQMANQVSGVEYQPATQIDSAMNPLKTNYPTLSHEQFVNMFLGGHFITAALS